MTLETFTDEQIAAEHERRVRRAERCSRAHERAVVLATHVSKLGECNHRCEPFLIPCSEAEDIFTDLFLRFQSALKFLEWITAMPWEGT